MLHPRTYFLAENFKGNWIGCLWCGYYGREFNAALKDNGGVILEVNAAPGLECTSPLLKVYPEMSQLLLLICFILRKIVPNSIISNWY
jgi:hypothetical protein